MTYLPNAEKDRAEMLKALELENVDGLFSHLPERLRLDRVDLPEPLSEVELVQYFRELGRLNHRIPPSHSFLGAGASRRFSPAIVNQVISRPDFYTTYTPYQAEASQGTLQATYEFQTMITLLTGLDVANASLYDGATSLAEATAMAVAHTNRQNVVVAGALHPEYAQVLQTYSEAQNYEVLRVAPGVDGRVDPEKLEQTVNATTAAVILQQPNFFGVLEDPQPISDLAHRSGALLIACVDPMSLGLLAAPGDYGADLAVGDGQPLGLPLSFGGPYLGFIACREPLLRRMPGRLVGATVDGEGRRGYVLTLQAREQHIRREHATSNITTNHALMALAATVYLAHMGGAGLKQLAELSAQRAHYLAGQLVERNAYRLAFAAPFLWEFVLRTPYPAEQTQSFMLERGVLAGLPLGRFFPELSNALLVSVTELNHPRAIEQYLEALA
ncbi:MAG: aminomethyl-transferring glycine dehydrogenase subunit GcvPA [Chloroflexi bacterium]|nr:MAG: aminomethyl-transferring glycine dehydrogenase subunit GcvPA [Chloroflexota bacterium]TMG49865.1 MAG: aminomethyl-transferring glycine dehydrogenase subunit GcvPA [Chloroflexota bacterium]